MIFWGCLYKSGAACQIRPESPDYFMPPTYSLWNTTNIILVDGNFNMVRGNFRHLDRSLSTTITNPDPFNETTTSPSLGKFIIWLCSEASRALIYNDQHQLSRYLLIPLLSVLTMIQIDPQAIQVKYLLLRSNFKCTFETVAHGLVLVTRSILSTTCIRGVIGTKHG